MKNQTLILLFALLLLACSAVQAIEIAGTIASTLVIKEDSWLTGDVTCKVENAPCIRVEASNITLWLNGFAITGQGDPPSGCVPGSAFNPAHGIEISNQRRVEVFGPGLIGRHRGWGIFLGENTTRTTVKDMTISSNCLSGIQLYPNANDNLIEGVVSVRNGNPGAGCGGICTFNSNYNRYHRNVLSGNGYTGPTPYMNFNFGLAISGRGNTASENIITGNLTGIFISASAVEGNIVYRNIITGNPPIQIPLSAPEYPGFDIRNNSPEIANTILDNVCETYSGPGLSPCRPSVVGELLSLFKLGSTGPLRRSPLTALDKAHR